MPYHTELQITRRWIAEIERLRARAARLVRQLPLDDGGAVELLESSLGLSESLLRELSGVALGSEALRGQVSLLDRRWTEVFDEMPVACVEANDEGGIVGANRAAAVLLNTSARHLQQRQLRPFVQDRERFASFLQEVIVEPSATHEATFTIRPRERAPIAVRATVMRRPSSEPAMLLWFLVPTGMAFRDAAGTPAGKPAARRRANGAGELATAAIHERF